jgi:hypothetical protein
MRPSIPARREDSFELADARAMDGRIMLGHDEVEVSFMRRSVRPFRRWRTDLFSRLIPHAFSARCGERAIR